MEDRERVDGGRKDRKDSQAAGRAEAGRKGSANPRESVDSLPTELARSLEECFELPLAERMAAFTRICCQNPYWAQAIQRRFARAERIWVELEADETVAD